MILIEEKVYAIDYIVENKIDKEAYGFIYITTNLVNGKKYIGQKKFVKDWQYYLGSGKLLKRAIKKYMYSNFYRDIIAVGYSCAELNELEIYYIKLYNAIHDIDYYNLASGGKNGNTFANKTKEEMVDICKKIREANLGRTHSVSEETRDIMRKNRLGKFASEETKRKIRENHADFSGGKHPMCGRKHTEIAKKNMSIAKIGKLASEETRQKMRENNAGSKNPNARAVILLNTKEIFSTIKDAKEKYNASNITACCRGRIKYSGMHPESGLPLTWMYYDEYLEMEALNN